MKKLIVLVITLTLMLLLSSCNIQLYKLPHDDFCYSDTDTVVDLEIEEKEYIINLLNEGKWHPDVAKCTTDYNFYTQKQSLGYNAEEGIFNDFTLKRSLTLSDEQKETVNEYLGYNQAEPDPAPDKSYCEVGLHTWDSGTINELGDGSKETVYRCTLCAEEKRIPIIYDEGEEYSFEELYKVSECIDVNNISKIKLDSSNISLRGYPLLHDVMISTDKDVINAVTDFIHNATLTLGGGLDGTGITEVTLYEGDKEFSFSYSHSKYLYVGDFCFTASMDYPIKGLYNDWYMYIEALGDIQLSTYGKLTTLTDFNLSEIQLTSVDVDLVGYDYSKDADLIVDGETIRIISADMIYWEQHGWFRAEGEKDFGEFIPEEEKESGLTFVNEDGDVIGIVFISTNVIYTLEELMYIADRTVWGSNFTLYNYDGSLFTDRAFGENEKLIVKYESIE